MLSSSRSNTSLPQELRHNNTFTTNPTLIANNFNDYFSGIGKTFLVDQLKPSGESEHTNYPTKRLQQSLFLAPTTSFEVFNLISGLKNTKSNGKDNICAYFLKVADKVIAVPLTQLFNCTYLLEIFLASLKIAKKIPMYKSGDKFDVSNYQPIPILSPVSKILKKLIHIRSIFSINTQSCCLHSMNFRADHSTSPALTDVFTKGGVEDTMLEAEAKAKDTKKIRGQGHKKNPRPRTAFERTDTPEAKDRNARGQGQGPRTQPKMFSKNKKKDLQKNFSGDLKKKVFKIFFQAISKQNGLEKNFSADLQNFKHFKTSAILEPRTGQFSRT